ncbi:MAG: glycosyltransferase family 1 protein [Candidatus Eisenbacteria bacterium]|nr:glycosyltransferase family 1 protein [Candidatus Eisenbacteria bacterium]
MNIVLDARTATDHFPGIGRYVVSLAHALASVVPNLSVLLLHNPLAPVTRMALPDLPRLESRVSPFSLRQQWVVPKALRSIDVAVYHSPYYLLPYRPGVPTVLTCYDLIPLAYPEYFSAGKRLIYRLAHMLALKRADAIVAISEGTKADLIRYFHVAPQRIFVTPLAAGAHFTPQPPERTIAVKEKYGLPEEYVLYFGSNKPHKNLVRLVKAFAESKIGGPSSNVSLVIAGHWDERYPQAKETAMLLHIEDRVIFLADVSENDLPVLYGGARLFVFPSLYEGFGLPVLEAMACGTPVVCSNTSSLPEVAGDAALLVNPLDVNGLVGAINRVLSDDGLQKEMVEKGFNQARRFSWERTARETVSVYERVVAGKL